MNSTLKTLASLVDRHWRRFGRETPLEGLLLTRAENSQTIRAVYKPSFCVVIQGSKTSMLGEEPFRYSAGQCLLASVEVPVTARIVEASADKPYLAFSLAINPGVVAELLIEQAATLTDNAAFSALSTAELPAVLGDPLTRLLELLDKPADLPVLAPLVQREIVWRLLNSPLGTTLRQIGLKESNAARIGKVTAWIHHHFAHPIRIADLAALANMSVPSFHRHFKAVTRLTPVQFQKQIRLQEARNLLLSSHDVAAVGYQVGYESASQFSRDYRRLFGMPPGRDKAAILERLEPEAIA